MSDGYQIVVCGSIVPDPLQTLEPIETPNGPALKNEMMLPAVLDPWASHALYEAANLAAKVPNSKVWLVSLAPKAKLQQVMMTIAQKVAFELVAVDGPASGFGDAHSVAAVLADAIQAIAGTRSFAAAPVWRMGIGEPWRWRDDATGRRATGHCRSISGRGSDHGAARWIVRSARAHRGRTSPGFNVRGSAGPARMGNWESSGAAQQSAGRHGEHAHGDAGAAAREARSACGQQSEVSKRDATKAAAANAHRKRPRGRRDRERNR